MIEFIEQDRCSNLSCPNKPNEGKFVLLLSTENIVGGHRPITMLFCSPCANGLKIALKAGE